MVDATTTAEQEEPDRLCARCKEEADGLQSIRVENHRRTIQEWCEDCRDNHAHFCPQCERYFSDNVDSTWYCDEQWCMACTANYLRYCEECDEYYHVDDTGDHTHEPESCDCQPHLLSFAFPNDGHEPLQSDVILDYTSPAGDIDDVGIRKIQDLLSDHSLPGAFTTDLVEPVWQTKRGNYPKRLARAYHEWHKGYEPKYAFPATIPTAVISEIGNIASAHTSKSGQSHRLLVTRDLNQSAEEFGNSGSCWWDGEQYGGSRCAGKAIGLIGLLDKDQYDLTVGRAWVMPLVNTPEWTPTFDVTGADAYMVFNCYGTLSGYAAARIVAYMTGNTYTKVSFYSAPMYINGSVGILVAPVALADATEEIRICIDSHTDRYVRRFNQENAA